MKDSLYWIVCIGDRRSISKATENFEQTSFAEWGSNFSKRYCVVFKKNWVGSWVGGSRFRVQDRGRVGSRIGGRARSR